MGVSACFTKSLMECTEAAVLSPQVDQHAEALIVQVQAKHGRRRTQ